MRIATLLGLAVALAACDSSDESRCGGGWHVCDGFLRDGDGRAVTLRGVNLAGAHKTAPYFGFHQRDDVLRLRADWGFNSVRFLILWAAIEPQPGVYDDGYLDAVAERIGWARDAGLVVVLDMHQDLFGEGFAGGDGAPLWACDASRYEAFEPREPWFLGYLDENLLACVDGFWTSDALQASYAAAWRRVAERLAAEPAVIGFDPMNEPHWGTYSVWDFEADRLLPLYQQVVAEVRDVAPGWIAFLEPSASRNAGIPTGLAAPLPPDVMYAPHSYDTRAESGEGFSPERRAALIDNAALLADEAARLQAGLWIGEYGGVADDPEIGTYMDAQYDAQAAVAGGSAYWSYDRGGYGLLDADGNEQTGLLDVVARPYPERIAGEPVAWTFAEESGTFELSYRPDRDVTAATDIAVPGRAYPAGLEVDCGGCSFELTANGVTITAPAAGDVVSVTLSPAPP